jgi:hypothetical protein
VDLHLPAFPDVLVRPSRWDVRRHVRTTSGHDPLSDLRTTRNCHVEHVQEKPILPIFPSTGCLLRDWLGGFIYARFVPFPRP